MNIQLNYTIKIEISQVKIAGLIKLIKGIIRQIFTDMIRELDYKLTEDYIINPNKYKCPGCGKKGAYTRKGFRKDQRKLITSIGCLVFPPLQMLRCSNCGFRFAPIFLFIGLKKYIRILDELKAKALFNALHTTYNWASKMIRETTGVFISKTTIIREVHKKGKELSLDVDKDEEPIFEIDGTGVPIKNSGKRGKEIKILAQHKKEGSIRVCNLKIDSYKKGWWRFKNTFKRITKVFKEGLIISDGEESIFKQFKKYIKKLHFQRCLFHIPYQLKHVLWEDGVKRSSEEYKIITSNIYSVVKIRKGLKLKDIDMNIIKKKQARFIETIKYCKEHNLKRTSSYLVNAGDFLFISSNKKLPFRKYVKTTSLIERLMREINFRIDVAGSWSNQGALYITKLRLGMIYNKLKIKDLY
jgi:hypothetical protein